MRTTLLLLPLLLLSACLADTPLYAEITYPPLELELHDPPGEPMAQRYTTPVATRVSGGVVSSSDQNDVDNRVVQLSADLGGVPGDLNSDDASSFLAAINEAIARASVPRSVAGPAFDCDATDNANVVKTNTGIYTGASGASMDVWAGIDLPHGKAITQLKGVANLTTSACQVDLDLRALNKSTGSSSSLASVSITGSSGVQSDTDTMSHTVDNATYAYFFTATLTNDAANQAILVAAEVSAP